MKYVVVTGAYGGMGKSVVKELVKNGYHVFALDKTVEEPKDCITPIEVDITCDKSVNLAFEKVKAITDNIYAILHFAGIYTLDSLVEMNEEKFIKAFDVNLFGAYRVNKAFISLLKDGSKILITTSELANLNPLPFTGVYAVTKSALDKYASSLRMEVQLLGVKVIVLRPGAVDTGMIDVSMRELDKFTENTKMYSCNAKRFKNIVEKVEARKISTQKLAKKTLKILNKKRPKQTYSINRNPLLIMLNVLPKGLQSKIIKKVLKP